MNIELGQRTEETVAVYFERAQNAAIRAVLPQRARTLEEAGIGVVHDPSLYDYPEYSGAYGRSLTAAERAMEEYPSISLVLA